MRKCLSLCKLSERNKDAKCNNLNQKKMGKKSVLLLLLCLFACSMNAQELRNRDNAFIGRIDSDGTMRNRSNACIGRIDNDGTVRTSGNASVGRIDSDGTIRNRGNATIGKVESDGTVRSRNNATIGKVERDGIVRNSSNACIGTAKGVPQPYAAVYFFFFEEMQK